MIYLQKVLPLSRMRCPGNKGTKTSINNEILLITKQSLLPPLEKRDLIRQALKDIFVNMHIAWLKGLAETMTLHAIPSSGFLGSVHGKTLNVRCGGSPLSLRRLRFWGVSPNELVHSSCTSKSFACTSLWRT